jgi:hypothetical protein
MICRVKCATLTYIGPLDGPGREPLEMRLITTEIVLVPSDDARPAFTPLFDISRFFPIKPERASLAPYSAFSKVRMDPQ